MTASIAWASVSGPPGASCEARRAGASGASDQEGWRLVSHGWSGGDSRCQCDVGGRGAAFGQRPGRPARRMRGTQASERKATRRKASR
jgi:hypothetical protein